MEHLLAGLVEHRWRGQCDHQFRRGALVFPAQSVNANAGVVGNPGTLTLSGGIYTFTDTSGTQYVFLPNGLLNYEQDSDGNRITLGYNTSNQLVTLTYSNPADSSEPTEQLSLSYNSQGFVSKEADGTGAVWTYAYDSAGHLLSVTAPGPTAAGLTTTYTYDTGTNAETANAAAFRHLSRRLVREFHLLPRLRAAPERHRQRRHAGSRLHV